MKWAEVREKFPDQFVLVEAIQAVSRNNHRIIEEMDILATYNDSKLAWKGYKESHRLHPEKELYIFHTGKENLEVIEQFFTGARGVWN